MFYKVQLAKGINRRHIVVMINLYKREKELFLSLSPKNKKYIKRIKVTETERNLSDTI